MRARVWRVVTGETALLFSTALGLGLLTGLLLGGWGGIFG